MNASSFLFIIIYLIIIVLLIILKSPGIKGKIGEDRVLNLIRVNYTDAVVLQNLYIPVGNGNTTEIDIIWITKKGIFVIECKNIRGWIFGDEKSKYWMKVVFGNKYQFYNPIMQNRNHIDCLKKLLGSKIRYYSIIVFTGNSQFKKLIIDSKDVYVVEMCDFKKTVDDLNQINMDILDGNAINSLKQRLSKYLKENVGEEIIKEHGEYVRNKKAS